MIVSETLPLRARQTSSTTLGLARWLEQHPKVDAVHYPFLSSRAEHERAKDLFAAGSWLLRFELRDPSR